MNPPPVGRQVHLPLSHAAGIAYRSIRLRLGRSLLVTAGIALAIAFLVSLQTADAVADGMRRWIAQAPPDAQAEAQSLEAAMRARGLETGADAAALAGARTRRRWVVGLALLVAFVGIVNAMFMSVTERFREIGTMKCLGALDGFIVRLFVLESLFQGVAGTLIGAFLGLAVALLTAVAAYGLVAVRSLPAGQVLAAVAVSVAVGIVLSVAGALLPAWQAARMQPVEALRAEW